jgi:hypothetical protein
VISRSATISATGSNAGTATSCSLKITFNAQKAHRRSNGVVTFRPSRRISGCPSIWMGPRVPRRPACREPCLPTQLAKSPQQPRHPRLSRPAPDPTGQATETNHRWRPPKILNFEAKVADGKVELCYGVENCGRAHDRAIARRCEDGAETMRPRSRRIADEYTLTARKCRGNRRHACADRRSADDAAAAPARVADCAEDPHSPYQRRSPPPPAAAVASSALPRVGDTWELSISQHVEERRAAHLHSSGDRASRSAKCARR